MRYLTMVFSSAVLLGGATLLSGCSGEQSATAPQAPAEAETAETETEGTAAAAAEEDLPAEVVEARAELPEADRQLVAAQRVCPVSGKTLGSMGEPIKLTVEGQEVFICCDGCEEPLKSEPQKHLSTL